MELLKDWDKEIKKKKKPREKGTNPRAKGTNPRAKGTNPRMSKRKSKATTIGKSDSVCKQCKGEMIVRKHKEITEKLRKQYYFFTQWDYCGKCNKVYFNEKNRMTTGKGADLEEHNRQQSFIKSI